MAFIIINRLRTPPYILKLSLKNFKKKLSFQVRILKKIDLKRDHLAIN
jgi:hypothetical protein